MWWTRPRRAGYRPLLAEPLLDVVARAHAVAQVGGLHGCGHERGRRFERLFYSLCESRSVQLCERAGAKTLAGQYSGSGLMHEVDGATKAPSCTTHWELKHLTAELPKNELLIFNAKTLDFLHGNPSAVARIPVLRFLLTGSNVRADCRRYAVLWGIMVIEPDRLALPLMYEALVRGGEDVLRPVEAEVARQRGRWGCRSVQEALGELFLWVGPSERQVADWSLARRISETLDLQEQVGPQISDYLDEIAPDWVDEAAEDTWNAVGGW